MATSVELRERRLGLNTTHRQDRHRFYQMRIYSAATAFLLLASACADPRSPSTALPTEPSQPAMSAAAGTRFGDRVGTFQGVDIFSNASLGKPAAVQSWQYGQKWECVEFARRYTSLRYGVMLPGVAYASDFWSKVSMPGSLRRVANGGVELPQIGDLIIMATNATTTPGHIAVFSAISSSSATIAQQNTVSWSQGLGISTSSVAGTRRYTLAALSGHTTLGWYTRKQPPLLIPAILGHAPLNPRVSVQPQSMSVVTSGVTDGAVLSLKSPSGARTNFGAANLSATPAGFVFRPTLSQPGTWTVELQSQGLTSAPRTFVVVR